MKKTIRHTRGALLMSGIALIAVCSTAHAAPKDDYRHYGGDQGGMRYSPLTAINKTNLNKIIKAWQIDMPVGGLQVQPIIINGVLYATTTDGKVFAADAATGVQKLSLIHI